MNDNQKTLKALHDLIATCNDAAEGFAKAAKGVHDADLSDWLAQASADRESFADQLNRAVKKMGDSGGQDAHEGGILHKGWVDLDQHLRSTEKHLSSKDDKEILRECIAGDSGSVGHFDHALAEELDQDLRMLIIEMKTTVLDNLTYLQTRVARKGHSA